MSEISVKTILDRATSTTEPSPGGSRLWKKELDAAWKEANTPELGDPPGKPITAGEARLFESVVEARMSRGARNLLNKILGDIPALLQSDQPTGDVQVLPVKRGHTVCLTHAGFAVDATGAVPANQIELCEALYHAGEWVQASFGDDVNMFNLAGLNADGKRAVVAQILGAVATPLDDLSHQQVDQMLGSACAVLCELFKSAKTPTMPGPGQAEQDRALRADVFAAIEATLAHGRTNPRIHNAIVGYMHKSEHFQALLEPAQRAKIEALYNADHPQTPIDYGKWDAQGKSVIRIDHACGAGEGFLFGFAKQLLNRGLGQGYSASGYEFELVRGNTTYGPADLKVTIPAGDPMNVWGREMTVEIHLRQFRQDMYKAMGDPDIDIVSYGGHSNFGGNTLDSLRYAPQQQGDKIIARDLCCGIDTTNAEARLYPKGSNNSVTSVNSSYFRTSEDPEVGKYASDSEGYHMLMGIVRGALGKKDWEQIGQDLENDANWWGHDSSNNWIYPGDARRDGARDDDADGIPNVFDVMPGVNTTDVAASVAHEFELELPSVPVHELGAGRAFQALQFVNTASNYNTEFDAINSQRKLMPHPHGIWFDGAEDPKTYVRITRGAGGKFYAQMSSALSSMTMETMRAVLYYESAKFFAEQSHTLSTQKEKLSMALLFAASSLVYDQAWRDGAVFDGLKKIYGIPDGVDYSIFSSQVYKCEERHNYTGDMTSVRDIVSAVGNLLAGEGVGEPALTVTA